MRALFLLVLACGCGAGAPARGPREPASASAVPSTTPTDGDGDGPASEAHDEAAPVEEVADVHADWTPVLSATRLLRTDARWPRVAVGASGALVTSGSTAPTAEAVTRGRDDVLVVEMPLRSGAIREVFVQRTFEEGREWSIGPWTGRVGDEAAVVSCVHDDFCADAMGGAPCDGWGCDLRVPGRRADDVHFALPHRALGSSTQVVFEGSTVFAVASGGSGGSSTGVFGFVVRGGHADRVLVRSFGDQPGTAIELALAAVSEETAVVSSWLAEGRTHHDTLTAEGRRDADAPSPRAAALAFVEERDEHDLPQLVTFVDGHRAAGDGLRSDAGRFSPCLLVLGGANVLVFAEGLRATTRIRAWRVDDSGHPMDEPTDVSAPGVEAGTVACDAWDGTGFLAWEERTTTGWSIQGATIDLH